MRKQKEKKMEENKKNWIDEMIERFKKSTKNISRKSLFLSDEEKIKLVKEVDFEAFKNLFLLVVDGILKIDISIKQDKRYNRDYNKWRKSVLKRDNYTCQECEAKDNLEVHHIKPLKFYPELYIEIDNGLTLCNKCHRKTDSYGYKVLSRYGRKIITTE